MPLPQNRFLILGEGRERPPTLEVFHVPPHPPPLPADRTLGLSLADRFTAHPRPNPQPHRHAPARRRSPRPGAHLLRLQKLTPASERLTPPPKNDASDIALKYDVLLEVRVIGASHGTMGDNQSGLYQNISTDAVAL